MSHHGDAAQEVKAARPVEVQEKRRGPKKT